MASSLRWLRLGLLGMLALYVACAVATWAFPYGLDYGEGPLTDQARRIRHGELPYQPALDRPPFVIANYPPIFPALEAGLSAMSGWSFLRAGRAVSSAAALLCALVCARLSSRIWRDRRAGAISALVLVGNPYFMDWTVRARVDVLALLFSLLGLWLVCRHWRSWPALLSGALCLAASIYTRQTFLLAVPAAATYWLWRCQRSRAALFAVLLGLLCAALFFWLNRATDSGFFLHTVIANLNPYRLTRTVSYFVLFVPVFGAAVALALLVFLSDRAQEPAGPALPRHLLAVYAVAALVPALCVGKVGSSINYFLELIAAVSLWAGGVVRIGRVGRLWPRILVVQVIAGLIGGSITLGKLALAYRDLPQQENLYRQVRAALAEGPILTDEAMAMVVLAGGRIYYQPFEYHQSFARRSFGAAELAGQIAARRFPIIILAAPGSPLCEERWGAPALDAVARYYRPVAHIGKLSIYLPQNLETS